MIRSSTHPVLHLSQLTSAIGAVLLALGAWNERRRQRRALEALSDAGLKDLGLSRADVARETGKWPWQP